MAQRATASRSSTSPRPSSNWPSDLPMPRKLKRTHGQAQFGQRARGHRHDLVVHGAALGRIGMADHGEAAAAPRPASGNSTATSSKPAGPGHQQAAAGVGEARRWGGAGRTHGAIIARAGRGRSRAASGRGRRRDRDRRRGPGVVEHRPSSALLCHSAAPRRRGASAGVSKAWSRRPAWPSNMNEYGRSTLAIAKASRQPASRNRRSGSSSACALRSPMTSRPGLLPLWVGSVASQRQQALRRFDAHRIPAALAVVLVGIGALRLVVVATAALRLEMVGGDHEYRTAAGAKRLRHRHPRAAGEGTSGQGRRAPLRLDALAAIDHRDANAHPCPARSPLSM